MDFEKAKEAIAGFAAQAEELVKNPAKLEELLRQLEEKIKEITSNPVLSQLDCVKNQRFATIQLESVLPGNRMAYSVERMAADFFPDLFK